MYDRSNILVHHHRGRGVVLSVPRGASEAWAVAVYCLLGAAAPFKGSPELVTSQLVLALQHAFPGYVGVGIVLGPEDMGAVLVVDPREYTVWLSGAGGSVEQTLTAPPLSPVVPMEEGMLPRAVLRRLEIPEPPRPAGRALRVEPRT